MPCELRDNIYELLLNNSLPSAGLQSPAAAITPSKRLHGEQHLRYPPQIVPPAQGLLLASKQLRTELLETVKRLREHYKTDLLVDTRRMIMSPTWASVPMLIGHIDIWEISWRFLQSSEDRLIPADRDSAKICSPFAAFLALLQRFAERGANFLDKKMKTSRKTRVAILDINIISVEQIDEYVVDGFVAEADAWVDQTPYFYDSLHRTTRETEQLGILCDSFGDIKLRFNGAVEREWTMVEE